MVFSNITVSIGSCQIDVSLYHIVWQWRHRSSWSCPCTSSRVDICKGSAEMGVCHILQMRQNTTHDTTHAFAFQEVYMSLDKILETSFSKWSTFKRPKCPRLSTSSCHLFASPALRRLPRTTHLRELFSEASLARWRIKSPGLWRIEKLMEKINLKTIKVHFSQTKVKQVA